MGEDLWTWLWAKTRKSRKLKEFQTGAVSPDLHVQTADDQRQRGKIKGERAKRQNATQKKKNVNDCGLADHSYGKYILEAKWNNWFSV